MLDILDRLLTCYKKHFIFFFFQEEEEESDEAILNERRLLSRYGKHYFEITI